ncbi:MAG TPA: right-handed parallel beta-helix repeat-containing protein [bacterium]
MSLVSGDLQQAINTAADGDTLILTPGRYVAEAHAYTETLCGNCQEQQTEVKATYGFVIDAKRLYLRAQKKSSQVILDTRAGYGMLVLNSQGTVIENMTITGGVRDADGRATDAAVVVKGSAVTLRRCLIGPNKNFKDSTIIGICGVAVREGGDARIEYCMIKGNSWDGVALYRGATAQIHDCGIDSGRGVGIGVTWDATAMVLRNRISHYWKGIGSFGTATVIARNNTVVDNLGWGIIASGASTMIAENNISVHNGNCGMAVWNKGARGRMVNNILAFNGWRKEWVCPCVGFWNQESDTAGWVISHNIVWDNGAGNVRSVDSAMFIAADPQFADSVKYVPRAAAIKDGDPDLSNPDGTRSVIGIYGGPQAKKP